MISFLQPLALLALVAAAGPALLHLFQRRVPPVVPFPAVQYLQDAAERHSRRLRLRNLLLLILRTAILLLLVLAAARPVARVPVAGGHAPVALALVVDHSLSSGAVVGGALVLDTLVARARRILNAASTDDRLWIVLADGVPRRASRPEAERVLADLLPVAGRLDLGEAVRAAAHVLQGDGLPGRVIVLSDNQATAWSPGVVSVPVLVWEATAPAVNRGLDSARAIPGIWTGRGRVQAAVGGTGGAAAIRLDVAGSVRARLLASPGDVVELEATLPAGWYAAKVLLDGDELRADDERHVVIRVMPPTPAQVHAGAGPFVSAGVDVLRESGRLAAGTQVTLHDQLGSGTRILLPPTDPALIGTLNRELQARGVRWRFGAEIGGGVPASSVLAFDDASVARRHRIEGGEEGVVATVGGTPWIVRAGDVVLVGSRLEPDWTDLPTAAAFLPFLDALINQVAAADAWVVEAWPGARVQLPEGGVRLAGDPNAIAVSGDGVVTAPAAAGVWLAVRGADTVGALVVNADARESPLTPAPARALRAALGPDVRVSDQVSVAEVFATGVARADLTVWLLGLALLMVTIEFVVAARVGRSTGGS
ncbi:MAG: VWA domain-containing protein [Gemmatimonadales bacterium]